MAKVVLNEKQQEQVNNFKQFVESGVKTKNGYSIDPKLEYQVDLSGVILAKGKVLQVEVPTTPSQLPGKVIVESSKTEKRDVAVFWNMQGNCTSNALFSLIRVVEI